MTSVRDEDFSMRILASLYEIGENDILSVLAATINSPQDAAEISKFKDGLALLVERADVTIGYETDNPREVRTLNKSAALGLLSRIEGLVKFHPGEQPHWTLVRGDAIKDSIPSVKLGASGRDKAYEIQMRLGYQWWRRNVS